MQRPRLVIVGSVNADLVVKGERLPAPGETVTGGRFVMSRGGKGANQAVAAARLGADVRLVAKVGSDLFGDQAIDGYLREGIRTDCILRDPHEPTGVALILVDGRGENLISVASGANHALCPADVEQAAERIRTADMVLLQLEIPLATIEYTAQLASAAGVAVILDPAPAPAGPLPASLLRHVTYLKPNESEAGRLTGISVDDEISAQRAAAALLDAGAKHVIITLGGRGALCAGPDGSFFVPGYPVEAIDTTAAGDAFSGALGCELARGSSLEKAVRYANMAGALAVTRVGAQASLPIAEEVRVFAEKNG